MKTKTKKEQVGDVIDITPTWEALTPLFFDWIDNGTPKQKEIVKNDILKLAKIVDTLKEEKADLYAK